MQKKKKESKLCSKSHLGTRCAWWGWCSQVLETILLRPQPAPPCRHVFGCSVVGAGRAQHLEGHRVILPLYHRETSEQVGGVWALHLAAAQRGGRHYRCSPGGTGFPNWLFYDASDI